MAVPSSGSLSMQDIACEKVFDNYNHPTDGLGLSQRAGIGAISLADLSTSGNSNGSGTSFEANNTNNAASDRPDGSQPHKMSEFYSYDHDATASLTSFASSGSPLISTLNVCNQSTIYTKYHDGISALPSVSDVVYTSSSGGSSNYASAGYYRATATGSDILYQVGSNGVVSSTANCGSGEEGPPGDP